MSVIVAAMLAGYPPLHSDEHITWKWNFHPVCRGTSSSQRRSVPPVSESGHEKDPSRVTHVDWNVGWPSLEQELSQDLPPVSSKEHPLRPQWTRQTGRSVEDGGRVDTEFLLRVRESSARGAHA